MQPQDVQLETLLLQARAGCQEAWCRIVDLCNGCIRAEIRQRLKAPMRSLFDVEDLAQEVWLNFLKHILPRRLFGALQLLRSFLRGVARNVVLRAHRQYRKVTAHAARSQERPQQTSATCEAWADPVRPALVHDECDTLLRDQSPRARAMLLELCDGKSTQEIAETLDVNVRTVQRVIRRAHGASRQPALV